MTGTRYTYQIQNLVFEGSTPSVPTLWDRGETGIRSGFKPRLPSGNEGSTPSGPTF